MEQSAIHLLVIDDDPADYRILREMLVDCADPSFTMSHALCLDEGLAQIARGGFDAVILDLNLPDSVGFEGLTRIVREREDIPVIVMTGAADEALGREAIRNNAADYLVKGRADAGLVSRSIGYAIERKHNEIALQKSRKEVEELNRFLEQRADELARANKELEAFSYSVSHDLRNPLNAITTCAEVLIRDSGSGLSNDSNQALGHIMTSANRMAQVITDLMTLSNISRKVLASEKTDLSLIAKNILGELRDSVPHRRARFDVAPGLSAVGDPGLLRIVVENLLRNAWKFTQTREEARIEFGIMNRNGRPCYFIRDNGVGFNAKDADKLFTPYKRLHSQQEFKGSGIGLAIVKRIIHRHHGEIWAAAEKDKGAAFYFQLP